MAKNKIELPMEKFVELPATVIAGQIMEVFTPEVRENYDVDYIKDMGRLWLVKLIRHPMVEFKYKGKE